MARSDPARKLRAALSTWMPSALFGLGFVSRTTGHILEQLQRGERLRMEVHRGSPKPWLYRHAEDAIVFGNALIWAALAFGAALAILSVTHGWLGVRRFRTSNPLAHRMALRSDKTDPPAGNWQAALFFVFVGVLGALLYSILTGGGHAALLRPTWEVIIAGSGALLLIPLIYFVAERHRWGERRFRILEQRTWARHAKALDRRLAADEKIHDYGLAFRVGRLTRNPSQPMIAVVTDRRLLVMRPILFGLDLVREEAVDAQAIGAARAETPSAVGDFFAARPGLGHTGVLVVDRLGSKNLRLRLCSLDDAKTMADALAELKRSETAGVGALAVADAQDEGGELSFAASGGELSTPK